MKAMQVAIMLLGTVLAATSSAAPPVSEQCCACVIHFGNEGPIATVPALFCAAVLGEDQRVDFEQRCSDQGGGTTCVSTDPGLLLQDNVDCSALLLEVDQIACPGEGAPVPLLGTGVLGALALGLAGLGAWAVRRRSAARSRR